MCSSIQASFSSLTKARAISADAARIRADVAVVGPLVVLGRLQSDDRAAVGDRQYAGLLAVEPFFNHQAIAGDAEDPLQGDLLDGTNRLIAIGADHHALAGRQPVGLDDDPAVVPVVQIMDRFLRIAEGLVIGGGNVGRASRSLQKTLLASIPPPPGWDRRSAAPRPGRHRRFPPPKGLRADNGQAHLVIPGKVDQGRKIVGLDRHILAFDVRAGIARGDENAVRPRAL